MLAKPPIWDWIRKTVNEEVFEVLARLPTKSMDALEISGHHWGAWIDFKSYEVVRYPQFDICFDVMPNKQYDVIVAEQVLEHLRYPYRAVRNVHRMLRPGGYFAALTPFLIPIHEGNNDYTRWTEEGLRYHFEECGFALSKIQTGSWGNRQCVQETMDGLAEGRGWPGWDEARHSLINEPLVPICVWIVAQKD